MPNVLNTIVCRNRVFGPTIGAELYAHLTDSRRKYEMTDDRLKGQLDIVIRTYTNTDHWQYPPSQSEYTETYGDITTENIAEATLQRSSASSKSIAHYRMREKQWRTCETLTILSVWEELTKVGAADVEQDLCSDLIVS